MSESDRLNRCYERGLDDVVSSSLLCGAAAGVLIYFPFLRPFPRLMVDQFGAGSMSVAWAHLIFNVTVGLAFLVLLDKVEPRLSKWFQLT